MKNAAAFLPIPLILCLFLSVAANALTRPACPVQGRLAYQASHLAQILGHLAENRFSRAFSADGDEEFRQVPAMKRRSGNGDKSVVIAGGSYILNREDTANGDVVILGGTGNIQGTVNGDLMIIGSKVTFSGLVNGDLVLIGSNLQNQPGAMANGDLVSFAAEISDPRDLKVSGEHIAVNTLSPAIPFLKEAFDSLAHLRPMSPNSPLSWSIAILLLLLRLTLCLFLRKEFASTDTILRERLVPAFLIGLAILSSAAVLSFLLLVTIVGIVALPLVGLAIFVLEFFGGTCVSCWIGKHIAPQLSDRGYAVYLWVIIGTAVTWVFYCIPAIGLITTSIYIVLGLGTASIYLFERYRPADQRSSGASTMKSDEQPASDSTALVLSSSNPGPATNMAKAQFLPRLAANLIDLIVLYVLLSSLHLSHVLTPAWVVYRFAMFTWRSATLGEIVLNLRVQRIDGSLLTGDYSSALIRALSSLVSLVPLGLGFIWILFNREHESWHDKISGSYVFQLSSSATHLSTDSQPGRSTPPRAS